MYDAIYVSVSKNELILLICVRQEADINERNTQK